MKCDKLVMVIRQKQYLQKFERSFRDSQQCFYFTINDNCTPWLVRKSWWNIIKNIFKESKNCSTAWSCTFQRPKKITRLEKLILPSWGISQANFFFSFFFFTDLLTFIGKADLQRGETKRKLFQLLVHSPSDSNSQR